MEVTKGERFPVGLEYTFVFLVRRTPPPVDPPDGVDKPGVLGVAGIESSLITGLLGGPSPSVGGSVGIPLEVVTITARLTLIIWSRAQHLVITSYTRTHTHQHL